MIQETLVHWHSFLTNDEYLTPMPNERFGRAIVSVQGSRVLDSDHSALVARTELDNKDQSATCSHDFGDVPLHISYVEAT